MKRVLLVAITFILSMYVIVANAEEFSIRNGIRFGLTLDEVKQIELEESGKQLDCWYDKNPVERNDNFKYWYCAFDINLAGYENSRIYYIFTEKFTLKEIVYVIRGTKFEDYTYMESVLAKYDIESVGSSNDVIGSFVKNQIKGVIKFNDAAAIEATQGAEIIGYAQRIIPSVESCVVIDHLAFKQTMMGITTSMHIISYTQESSEVIDSITKKQEENQHSIDNHF